MAVLSTGRREGMKPSSALKRLLRKSALNMMARIVPVMIIGPPTMKTVGAWVGSQLKTPGASWGARLYQGTIQMAISPSPSSV